MTDHKASEQSSFVQPDEARPAAQQADELFVHGLLGTFHDREGQRRRLSAALGALSAPSRPARLPGRRLRRLVAAAVLLVVIAGVLVLQTSGSGSAYAVVSASLDAAKGPSPRRYELRLAHWPKNELPKDATGTLDSGPAGAFLSFNAPDGHLVRVGKDQQGEWAIRLDGEIEREHPRMAWPKWVEVGDDAMLADSVDHLLEGLLNEFVLASDGKQLLPGGAEGSKTYKHIHGTRKEGARRPQPDGVDLWIDSESNVLERLEMTWPKPPEGRQGKPEDARGEPGVPGSGPGPGGDGPEGRRGGPDGDKPPPEGPDGPGGDSRRPHDGPEGGGPDGAPNDGPNGGPDEPRDGPPDHPRRRPMMDGPGGPGDPDGPRPGMRGPQGLDGPRPSGGLRPRVSRLILTRVEAPAFEEGWFSPEKHK